MKKSTYGIRALRCPIKDKGCGAGDEWMVALDRKNNTIVAECSNCGYRYMFPTDTEKVLKAYSGRLNETGLALEA
jgi:hypothetical protein